MPNPLNSVASNNTHLEVVSTCNVCVCTCISCTFLLATMRPLEYIHVTSDIMVPIFCKNCERAVGQYCWFVTS